MYIMHIIIKHLIVLVCDNVHISCHPGEQANITLKVKPDSKN